MEERKYFIPNEYGEVVRVTREQYLEYYEKNRKDNTNNSDIPTFQTPEQQEQRRRVIDQTIEGLNEERLTDEDMYKIENGVQRGNRERLDDDIKSFQTPQQQEAIDGKDSKIQSIIEMLNALNLSEEEMSRIESEVERVSESDDKENASVEKNSKEENSEEK